MHRQGGVVGLHHRVRHFGRRHHRVRVHNTVGVFFADLGNEQSSHARAGATAQRVRQLESLQSKSIVFAIRRFSRFRLGVQVPAGNRSSRPPCGRRRGPSRPVLRPQCSDPWPSCCQRRTGRRRSCRAWTAGRKDPIAPNPWCPARDRRAQHAARTCHRWPRYNKRWCVPAAAPTRRGRCHWAGCRARRRWSPRTKFKISNSWSGSLVFRRRASPCKEWHPISHILSRRHFIY